MKDPYQEVWDSIGEALNKYSKIILWIAEHTLSAKDYKEFINEFTKEDNKDELIDKLRKGKLE